MRPRISATLSGAALALFATAFSIPSADASVTGITPPKPAGICQQNDAVATDTGFAVPDQLHTGSTAALSTKAAMLIHIPPGSPACAFTYLVAYGKLTGTGPITKVNLAIKQDVTGPPLGHRPSATSFPGQTFNNLPVTTTFSSPYTIITTSAIPAFTFTPGAYYWVQMQVRMNASLGQWSWEVVTPDPAGNSDEWRNPSGAGYPPCNGQWKYLSASCLGTIPGKGLMGEADF